MAALFDTLVSSYLVNSAPTVLGYPFSVGIMVRLKAASNVIRGIWALSSIGTSTDYFEIRMSATEVLQMATSSSLVAQELLSPLGASVPDKWQFILARFISPTNRNMSVLAHTGNFGTTVGVTNLNPSGLSLMTIGAISTAAGLRDANVTVPWDGSIAEFWMTNSDAYPSHGGSVNKNFMVSLKERGPFAFPNIGNNIVEYRSFRKYPTHEANDPNEVYYISSQAIRWANVNGVGIAPHAPLVPQYQDGFTPFSWRAIKQGWMVSTAAPATEQQFVRFPARMDGIGYGGIFPGGRMMDKVK